MRVTIIKEDNAVYVDGVSQHVDCSDLPADFHALQWDGASGELEHSVTSCPHCGVRSKKGNEAVSDIAPYQKYVDSWYAAKTKADEALAALLFTPAPATTEETGTKDVAG